jgi:hypothetical protein
MAIILKDRESGERFIVLGFAKSFFWSGILACDKSGDLEYLPLRSVLGCVATNLKVESVDGQKPDVLIEALRRADAQAIRKSFSEEPGEEAGSQGDG